MTTTEDTDVTQGSQIADTTGSIESVEHAGKGAEMVGARGTDLAHDVDQNGTRLTDAQLHTGAAVARAQAGTHTAVGGCHRHARHRDGTIVGDGHRTLRRDGQLIGLLGSTIDIDDQLVARPQDIVLGRGYVHIGLKRQQLVVEDVVTEDLADCIAGYRSPLVELRILQVGISIQFRASAGLA